MGGQKGTNGGGSVANAGAAACQVSGSRHPCRAMITRCSRYHCRAMLAPALPCATHATADAGAAAGQCTPIRCVPMGCGNVNPTSIGNDYQRHDQPGVTVGAYTGGDIGEGHVDFSGQVRCAAPIIMPSLPRWWCRHRCHEIMVPSLPRLWCRHHWHEMMVAALSATGRGQFDLAVNMRGARQYMYIVYQNHEGAALAIEPAVHSILMQATSLGRAAVLASCRMKSWAYMYSPTDGSSSDHSWTQR